MEKLRYYQLPDSLEKDIEQFERDIEDFIQEKISPIAFKAIRVAHGVYEQRQPDTYMIRIRCAACGITPEQLRKVGELGEKYGSGEAHITTRSEVQIHDVLIENVITCIRELKTVGLSSRGGGGNTIRNILTSSDSGISLDEEFDVDPYAMALTSRMISEEDSWSLPRKFKIAFSNSSKDSSFTQATCLGFIAINKEGQKGFRVYCAGGMGANPMIGNLLFDWVPDTQVYAITRALKIMFDRYGNRKQKSKNRIKFLWKKLEREDFLSKFMYAYEPLKDDKNLFLQLPILKNLAKNSSMEPELVSGEKFDEWKARFVKEQKQDRLYAVNLPLVKGDILKKDVDILCDFLAEIGENTIRCGRAQNIRLRNIPEKYLGNLFNLIMSMEMTLATKPVLMSNMINCTGASTCKLGICLPRGLSDALRDSLTQSSLDLDRLNDFHLNMSGCPNTCGMHHIADLGFFGKVGRNNGNMYPVYNVLAGAKRGMGTTEYAQKVGECAAHNVPTLVVEFLGNYLTVMDNYKDYQEYLAEEGFEILKNLCEKYLPVPALEEDAKWYTDFGANKRLSMDEIGQAECSAGMFDMIGVDKNILKISKKRLEKETDSEEISKILYRMTFSSARMLLVARGLDGRTDEQVFDFFAKHFIGAGLVKGIHSPLIKIAKEHIEQQFIPLETKESVLLLATDIMALHDSMDESLKFHVEARN